jgi:DNA-binding NtrC family response regulator
MRDIIDIMLTIPAFTSLDTIETAYIIAALEKRNGNRSRTARELKIPLRSLRKKLSDYRGRGIEVPEYKFQGRPKKPSLSINQQ